MHISVVSLFPQMFSAVVDYGITARAMARGLLKLDLWNPRDFAQDRHRTVDDRPYGGGPGMVMQVQPLRDAIWAAKGELKGQTPVLHLTPQGRRLDQQGVARLATYGRLLLVCTRYEGVDERLIMTEVDEEWSIGDYVLTGGELAAMVVIDALTRLLPGALGHEHATEEDSFAAGLLEHPHYTRPVAWQGLSVPQVLLSGDHEAIRRWRLKQALGRTWLRRPDLLGRLHLSDEQQSLLDEFVADRARG